MIISREQPIGVHKGMRTHEEVWQDPAMPSSIPLVIDKELACLKSLLWRERRYADVHIGQEPVESTPSGERWCQFCIADEVNGACA